MKKDINRKVVDCINEGVLEFASINEIEGRLEDITVLGDNESENVYVEYFAIIENSNPKYQVYTFGNEKGGKYEGVLSYDGELMIYNELASFLSKKVLNETGVELKFEINHTNIEEIVNYRLANKEDIEDVVRNNEQKKLLLDKLELINSPTLNIMNSVEAKEKFVELADQQRGEPESIMINIQKFLGGGILSYNIEHIGDLTHRIAQRIYVNYDSIEAALDDIVGKINNGIGCLSNLNDFTRRHKLELESIFEYKKDRNELEGVQDKEGFNDLVEKKLKSYADSHSEIPVYNIFQLYAREAAVNLGLGKYDLTLVNLMEMDKIIKDGDFVKIASSYDPDFGLKIENKLLTSKKIEDQKLSSKKSSKRSL